MAKLAAVLLWQFEHCSVPVGMCGGVVMPCAVLPLWQVAQLVSVAACLKAAPPQLVKPPEAALAWQLTQSAPPVATWFGYDAVPSAPLVPCPVKLPL